MEKGDRESGGKWKQEEAQRNGEKRGKNKSEEKG